MRKHYKPLGISLVVLGLIAAGLIVLPAFLPAQTGQTKTTNSPNQPATTAGAGSLDPSRIPLPIHRVILFTSGVGFFQREGDVDGDARVDLAFPVRDINDLLKSLVLRDLDGGKIRTVGYDSHEPLEKALKGYVIDLSGNPSFFDILKQARGERVELSWFPSDARMSNNILGTVLGVEKKKQPTVRKEEVVEAEFLNLWADGNMRSIRMSEITQVRFLNPLLNSEVNRALEVVSQGRDSQQKTLSFQFTGKGKRHVQVGYVVEHPIWKTSYRLVLDQQGKPFLQGWAMVENPTNEDWKNVNVALVSGRPISFRMDLYEPLYIDRPLVQLPQFANLKPRAYEGELQEQERPQDKALREAKKAEGRGGAKFGFAGRAPAAPAPMEKAFERLADAAALQASAPSAAQGVKLGEQFQYVIDQPVTLSRQKSAMLPIVNSEVDGQRLSIFNEQNLATNPLLGLRLKNSTPLHLMQGPITVFDQGSYAGDSLIQDLQPGEERLLSFAVDLGMEIKTETKAKPQDLIKIAITRGILHKTIVQQQTKNYIIKNRAESERLVVLEHPDRSPDFNLVEPKKVPAKSRNFYRFEVKIPAGKTNDFPVVEQKKVVEEIILTNADDQTLALLIKNPVASEALKSALQKAVDLKNKLAETTRQIQEIEAKVKTIAQDQERQRNNMKVIPQTDPVYKKYLDQFLKQEEQIQNYRTQVERLQTTVAEQRRAFEQYVMNLTVTEEKK